MALACACTSLRTNRADGGDATHDGGSAGNDGSAGEDGSLAGEGGAGEGGSAGHAGGGSGGSASGGDGGGAASSGEGGQSGEGGDSGGGGDPMDAADDSSLVDGACDGGECDGAVPECESCVPEPPSGWLGPVVLADTEINDCGGAFPTARADLNNNLVAPAASCTCECGDVKANCGSMKFRQSAPAACGSTPGPETFIPLADTCTEVPQSASCGRGVFSVAASGATCDVIATEVIEPPTWGSDAPLRICAGNVRAAGCGNDQLCMPEVDPAFLADACIYRSGHHACPAEWPDSYQGYDSVVDDRDCTQCNCEAAGVPVCSSTLGVFSDPECETMTDSTTVTGTTGSAPLATLDPMYMSWTHPTVSGVTCTPEGGEPTGAAGQADKHTVCCR